MEDETRTRGGEHELPPAGWGGDLDAEQREVRRTLRVVRGGRPPPSRAVSELVSLPRFAPRSGLFAQARRRGSGELRVSMGEVALAGTRLRWSDLRLLALITTLAEQDKGAVARSVLLPGSTAVRYMGIGKNSDAVKRARVGLGRLCEARFSLSVPGFGDVGSSARPERFVTRDPRDDDLYHLRDWFRELLILGYRQPESGLMERKLSWPLVCALRERALGLYTYLECENWRDKLAPDPFAGGHPRVGWRQLWLEAPMLCVFALDEAERKFQRRKVAQSMRVICGRDWRYRGWRFTRRQSARRLGKATGVGVEVYRMPEGPTPGQRWLGALCGHCGRPDPEGVCCCRGEDRCGGEACPRCREQRERRREVAVAQGQHELAEEGGRG